LRDRIIGLVFFIDEDFGEGAVGADLGEAEHRVLHEVESTHAEQDKVEQDAEVP